MTERDILSAKRPFLEIRYRTMEGIRSFFREEGFTEIRTPLLTTAPAPESNIEAVPADGRRFLITSPELYMKRLLAAGYDRIFQLTPVFRSGERGRLHHPEFTLLEWYRLRSTHKDLQRDCQKLLRSLAKGLGITQGPSYRGRRLDPAAEWRSITVREAFLLHAGWDPVAAPNEERFDQDLVEKVEPGLGFPSPCFLEEYPANQAALARLKESDPTVAERFELYWAGVELANGFTELTDAAEQRARFNMVLENRRRAGLPPYPLPEAFLESVEHLPPCAGIALGVDRLVMLFSGADSIDQVVAFHPELA